MKPYLQIMKIHFKNSFVYKIDTLLSIFGSVLALFVQLFLWRALLSGEASAGEQQAMVTYQVMGLFLGIFYNNSVAFDVGGKVRDGSIALDLIKPYNFAASMFSGTFGRMASDFLLTGVPFLIIAAVFTGIQISMPAAHIPVLALVILINMLLYWLLYYIIGLLHFVFVSAKWFAKITGDVIRIFGGGFIPLWFFPEGLGKVVRLLPFQLMYQFPQSILTGQITNEEIRFNLMLLCLWIAMLAISAYLLWMRGIKKITVFGG